MAFDRRNLKGRFSIGSKTETAGTVILGLIPPKSNGRSVLSLMRYTTAGTAHTLSVLRSQGSTTTTASAIATATSLILDSVAPAKDSEGVSLAENLAANDYIVVEHADGTHGAYLISAVDTGTKTVTINALAKAVDSGAPVYAMYEVARTVGIPSIQLTTVVSSTEDFPAAGTDPELGIASSHNKNEPLLIHSNNITAAGTLRYATACYTDL